MGKSKLIDVEALVLKTFPYSESSLIVRFFSKEIGRFSFIAKGVKKSKKQTSVSFEPFSHLSLTLYIKENSDLATLKEAQLKDSFYFIRQSLDSIALASFFFEALDKAVFSDSESETLFSLAMLYLNGLEGAASRISWTIFCLFRLLAIIGFQPDVSRCRVCGKSAEGNEDYFDILKSGIVCASCAKDEFAKRRTGDFQVSFHPCPKSAVDAVSNCVSSSLEDGMRLCFSRDTEKSVMNILVSYLSFTLETKFQSEVFLRSIF